MKFNCTQCYRYQTNEALVGSGRGFGHLTGFFKKDAPFRGGVTKTDSRNKPEWRAFYDREGDREGPVIHYWPEGNVRKITHYRRDKMHGQLVSFFRNGNIESMAYFKDGELVEESNFRSIEPSKAKSKFYDKLEKANLQIEAQFHKRFLGDIPEDSMLKQSQLNVPNDSTTNLESQK